MGDCEVEKVTSRKGQITTRVVKQCEKYHLSRCGNAKEHLRTGKDITICYQSKAKAPCYECRGRSDAQASMELDVTQALKKLSCKKFSREDLRERARDLQERQANNTNLARSEGNPSSTSTKETRAHDRRPAREHGRRPKQSGHKSKFAALQEKSGVDHTERDDRYAQDRDEAWLEEEKRKWQNIEQAREGLRDSGRQDKSDKFRGKRRERRNDPRRDDLRLFSTRWR